MYPIRGDTTENRLLVAICATEGYSISDIPSSQLFCDFEVQIQIQN